jgi:hypothetical protein
MMCVCRVDPACKGREAYKPGTVTKKTYEIYQTENTIQKAGAPRPSSG